ncbi:branched-chain amino acid ABC transporter permease [Thioclava sp. BHET1]|nr:branched-chain amino acid ABC transporter permease [Thioclava sp. BHET1]
MTSPNRSSYWRGVRGGLPFILVVTPFGLLFGVVATGAGLPLGQVMGFSALVVAGAAQFTALQMMQAHAPTLIVLLAALAVNLRMAMYSASLAPHLGRAPLWQRALIGYLMVDQSYALSISDYERAPEAPLGAKVAYYFGTVTPVVPMWFTGTFLGATLGTAIPPGFALDFALPITFLAMIAPMLRTLAHVAATVTSVICALALAGLPYHMGLLLAAIAAMIIGARVEAWVERRRAQWG